MGLVLGHGHVWKAKIPRRKVHVLEQVLHGVEEQCFIAHDGLNNTRMAVAGMVMLAADAGEHGALFGPAGLGGNVPETSAVWHVV